jgi:predicted transcriptional regulator
MPGGGVRGFGELEAAIMNQVWSAGQPVLVREIHDRLRPERELAYSTVLTVVEILYRKGYLARERDGRAYRYRATASREEYTAGLMSEAFDASADRLGTLRRFVARIDPAEAAELRAMLDEARGDGDGS